MNISIIGTGRMGQALAKGLAQAGHHILFGSRDVNRAAKVAQNLIEDGSIMVASLADAAAHNDVSIFAFPWYALVDVERAVGPLKGKTIIDCINPVSSSGSLALGHKRSAGEEIQTTFPLAKVVKGFNHIYCDHVTQPIFEGKPLSAFYCSDHDSAKSIFHSLAADLGFNPIDTGPIKHARYLEPLAVLWLQMAFHMGMGPDFALTLVNR